MPKRKVSVVLRKEETSSVPASAPVSDDEEIAVTLDSQDFAETMDNRDSAETRTF